MQVTAKDKGTLVKWTREYEKVNEDVPDPHAYLEFAVNITKILRVTISAHNIKITSFGSVIPKTCI
ncbi:hypothetical protein CK203_011583 [Vitis vinifera]|uniref:Bet v I/Major latex protein domain-containing protein n=1 Tax=Vitis vinifera TaxID=29760 RepID=A0A438JUH2_VITVI|nr:hypothetical protein CK203_011583 [Vitis vinifera]